MNHEHTICLLNDSFPPIIDGVANAVVNYGSIIESGLGHSIVVTPDVPGADDSSYIFPVVRYPSIDTRKLMGYVTGYPFSPEAAHVLAERKAELLHTHCPMSSAILSRQLAESMNLPLVLTWHTKYDIDIANAIRSKVLQEGALQALLRNVNACDEVWTVSKGAGENLKSIGYEGEYIVMPNGVDLPHEQVSTDLVTETVSGYDLPHDVPCYLFIGRLMWYKGLRIVLDALSQIKNEGIDFRMVFVGGGGDEAEVMSYAASLGLGRSVIFTGPVSDREKLRAWYSRADLFLFPSTFDTNGLVVREAAASDTASVIIKDSCASEGVTDGRNGFLIDENAESLAAILREVSARPDLMQAVGANAGSELYISWSDAVARAYERYEVVIDRYKSGFYGVHDPLRGSWMQSQGELMQILGNAEAAGKSIKSDLSQRQQEIDMKLRSKRNKALTDLITTGYEARQEVEAAAREARISIDTLRSEVRESIDIIRDDVNDARMQLNDAADEFWERLERYL